MLRDNLCNQKDADISMDDLHHSVKTWLTVGDGESVQREEVELDLQRLEMEVDNLLLSDDQSSGDEGSPETFVTSVTSVTSTLPVSQVQLRLEEARALHYIRGSDGTYRQAQVVSLSKVVYGFTRDTQERRRAAGRRYDVQATLFDLWSEKP